MKRRVVRWIVAAAIAITLVGSPAPAQAQITQCQYWLQQYLWYSMRFNEWMTYYQQSGGDEFYYWIADAYYGQMLNALEGIEQSCPNP